MVTAAPSTDLSGWWRSSATLSVCLLLLRRLTPSTVFSLIDSWSSDPLGHGYIVIPGVLFLVWHQRAALRLVKPEPWFWALPLLACCGLFWLLGKNSGIQLLEYISLIGVVIVLVWGTLGPRIGGLLTFPLSYLIFALPLVDRFVPLLQTLTAHSATKLLRLSSVPALLESHHISIPGSAWSVEEACSGVNYLMSSLAAGYLYAGTRYRRGRYRLGFLIAAAAIALVANVARVYGTFWLRTSADTIYWRGHGTTSLDG